MQREGKAATAARHAAAPLHALHDHKAFAKELSKRMGEDKHFHDADEGSNGKRAAWWRAKILTSSFLVYCRTNAAGGPWTQDQLAQALGVSRSYVAQVESLNSMTKASLELLIQAATVTGTPFHIGVPVDTGKVNKRTRRSRQDERTGARSGERVAVHRQR